MSTFSGLNTALTSLWAQRRGLDVTGQNIANVNTEGYSRQRVDMKSIGPNAVPAIFSTSPNIGGGVNADQIARIRDMFLETRAHTEHATLSRLTEQDATLTQVQQAFREPGDSGLQSMLGDMWAGWSDLANQPSDLAARSQLLQQVQTVTTGLRSTRAALDQQWTASQQGLVTLVAEVNNAASAVADLNQGIQRAQQNGLPANELIDKRDALVVKLADQIGATTRPGDDGMLNVYVSGTPLVFGTSATALHVVGALTPDDVATQPPRIEPVSGNYPVSVGGTAQGRVAALNDILPTYRNRLDATAANLAAALNAGQAAGYDLNGNPGAALLSSGPAGGPVTAANITVAITDPRELAASSVAPPPPPAQPTFDGTNADKISQLSLDPAGATAGYRQLIVDLGVQGQSVTRSLDIQNVISTQVDASREASAGVNLDEEMANMVAYQHAYEAASRMVSAIDQTLDTLINRTGLVGR